MMLNGVITAYFSFIFALYTPLAFTVHTDTGREGGREGGEEGEGTNEEGGHGVKLRDSQIPPLVKVHRTARELPRREHVQHLSDVGVDAGDELVDHVCWDLHLLSAGRNAGKQVRHEFIHCTRMKKD